MKKSISLIFKELLQNRKHNENSNIFIYSQKENMTLKKIANLIIKNSSIQNIEIEDVLTNSYFHKNLSLLQNLNFFSNVYETKYELLLEKYNLRNDFNKLKYEFFSTIGQKIWSKFEISFYIQNNTNLLIEKNNFLSIFNNLLSTTNIELNNNKQIYFLSPNENIPKTTINFDVYLYVSNNSYNVYDDKIKFLDEINRRL